MLFFSRQYIKDFYNETLVESYDFTPDEELLTVLYSLTVSIFAVGGMTGALLVGRLVTTYGRLVCVHGMKHMPSHHPYLLMVLIF